jgi:hypothetical protein
VGGPSGFLSAIAVVFQGPVELEAGVPPLARF